MKKQLFFLIVGLLSLSLQAQLVLTTTGMGTVGVEYGNDYSLFDPAGESVVYLYMWIDQVQTTPELPFVYNDEWGDSASLVVINYSATDDKFIGEIDFNTHDFIGEGILPGGTGIDDFHLILRNEAGTSQSANLDASTYGFAGIQTLGNFDFQAERASYYANDILHLNGLNPNEAIEINIFDSLGKQIYSKSLFVSQGETIVDLSSLPNVFAVVHIQTASGKYFVKKVVL